VSANRVNRRTKIEHERRVTRKSKSPLLAAPKMGHPEKTRPRRQNAPPDILHFVQDDVKGLRAIPKQFRRFLCVQRISGRSGCRAT
jgi:hypothetical protein